MSFAQSPVSQRDWTTTTITKSSAASAHHAAMPAPFASEIKWSELNDNQRQRDAGIDDPRGSREFEQQVRELRIDVLVWDRAGARLHGFRSRAARGQDDEEVHLKFDVSLSVFAGHIPLEIS